MSVDIHFLNEHLLIKSIFIIVTTHSPEVNVINMRMRGVRFGPSLSPGVKNLIIFNVIIFVLQFIIFQKGILISLFALWPDDVANNLFIWQLFTYQFLHGGLFHILANMFMLWMFGSELEDKWGKKEFYKFYFTCAIGAGIIIFGSEYFFIGRNMATLGASGAVTGIMLAYAIHWPDRYFLFWFLVPIKSKYLILGFLAISIIYSFAPTPGSNISHSGHLGGMITGFLYFILVKKINVFQSLTGNPVPVSEIKHKAKQTLKQIKRKLNTKNHNINMGDPATEEKVNQLLDKISEKGIHSLTEDERSFLTQFAQKKREEDADN